MRGPANIRIVLAVAALVVVVVSGGCGNDNPWGTGIGPIEGEPNPSCSSDDSGDGAEAVFVVDSLSIGGNEVGFDLDGVDTPGEDGPGGIDNQLGPMLDQIAGAIPSPDGSVVDPNALVNDALRDGLVIVLLRMLDVDDWSNDGCVTMYTYAGYDTYGTGAVQGGTYQVDARSLLDGNDIDNPIVAFRGNASLSGGTFEAGPGQFSASIPIGIDPNDPAMVSGTLHHAMTRWQVGPDGVRQGVMGGYINLFDILAGVGQIAEAREYMTVVAAVLRNQADIDALDAGEEVPNSSCTPENVSRLDEYGNGCGPEFSQCSPAGHCVEPAGRMDALSVGLSFTASPARIEGVYHP